MSRTVLITSVNGFVSRSVIDKLLENNFRVLPSTRNREIAKREKIFYLDSNSYENYSNLEIDAIIHTASYYSTSNDLSEFKKLISSNLGTADSIVRMICEFRVPIITTQSYLEKCPVEFQPWSIYAATKMTSYLAIRDAAKRVGVSHIGLYLYDNYGTDLSRHKIFEILLNSAINKSELRMTGGKQVLNFTHIDDVAINIVNAVNLAQKNDLSYCNFQIRSAETLKLKELVQIIEESLKFKLDISWGALPYREKEVFKLWNSAPDLPYSVFNWDIKSFILNKFGQDSLST